MSVERKIAISGGLYALAAIITFGHAAASAERTGHADYQQCLSQHKEVCWRDDAKPSMVGMMGAMLWPLYWSWEAWS